MYVYIENNEIERVSQLPRVWKFGDGRTVSGFHLLDNEIHKQEGWLFLEDNPPLYNVETEYLTFDGYEILEDKVIKKYKIENIPEPTPQEPNEIDILKTEIEELKQSIDIMLGGEIIE